MPVSSTKTHHAAHPTVFSKLPGTRVIPKLLPTWPDSCLYIDTTKLTKSFFLSRCSFGSYLELLAAWEGGWRVAFLEQVRFGVVFGSSWWPCWDGVLSCWGNCDTKRKKHATSRRNEKTYFPKPSVCTDSTWKANIWKHKAHRSHKIAWNTPLQDEVKSNTSSSERGMPFNLRNFRPASRSC